QLLYFLPRGDVKQVNHPSSNGSDKGLVVGREGAGPVKIAVGIRDIRHGESATLLARLHIPEPNTNPLLVPRDGSQGPGVQEMDVLDLFARFHFDRTKGSAVGGVPQGNPVGVVVVVGSGQVLPVRREGKAVNTLMVQPA